ncbi:MAG: N-acetylglucosamine-6-phosphate deacetylase [Thermofilaceae archaeon]
MILLLALRHLKIVTKGSVIDDGYIIIDDGKIVEIGKESLTGFHGSSENCEGMIAVPGFIDTHIHGFQGSDVRIRSEPETFLEMSSKLVKYGVTSFTPSTSTASHEMLLAACKAVHKAMNLWRPAHGARIIGLHLEGPYISKEMAGAQNISYIRKPNIKELREYIETSGYNIVQLTIAPEVKGALKLITIAKELGIVVSAGHTNATYEEGVNAIKAGITKATHLFNGMRKMQHRDPGIALALIEDPDVYLELIVDYVHVHPAMIRHVIKYAGPSRVILITDAAAPAGCGDGIYEINGRKLKVEQGIVKLLDKDVLAGSTLDMLRAFQNVLRLGFGITDASKMASTTPAKCLGLDSKLKIGELKKGYTADIVILDGNYNIKRVYVEGELAYIK